LFSYQSCYLKNLQNTSQSHVMEVSSLTRGGKSLLSHYDNSLTFIITYVYVTARMQLQTSNTAVIIATACCRICILSVCTSVTLRQYVTTVVEWVEMTGQSTSSFFIQDWQTQSRLRHLNITISVKYSALVC